jgi:hypothetical protein
MVLMFVASNLERSETRLLSSVDTLTDDTLAHRFSRHGTDPAGKLVEGIDAVVRKLAESAQRQTDQQTAAWGQVLERSGNAMLHAGNNLADGLGRGLEQALAGHLESFSRRVESIEQQAAIHREEWRQALGAMAAHLTANANAQHASLTGIETRLGERLAGPMEALKAVVSEARTLSDMQRQATESLHSVAGSAALEETLHTLTAAAHLLAGQAARGRAHTVVRQSMDEAPPPTTRAA